MNLVIEFGETVISPGNQTFGRKVGVQNITYHPQFLFETREHDLCLLRSRELMDVSDFLEPFANLATPNSRFTSGTKAVHAGKLIFFTFPTKFFKYLFKVGDILSPMSEQMSFVEQIYALFQ